MMREFERQMKALRIGNTPLKRLPKVERRLGVRRLFAKLEGANPTGTHKDRMALLLVLNAHIEGFDTVAAATCGNYGAALLDVVDKLGMRCKIYIPSEFEGIRSAEITDAGGEIIAIEGDYEMAIRACASDSRKNGWFDANPGGGNQNLGIFSYTYISKELGQELGRQPDWVAVPVGNGTVLAGVWQGFLTMGMKPRMLGTSNNNAAVRGIVMGSDRPVPVPDMKLTRVNDPLAGNFSPDAEDAIRAVKESNGKGMEISDEEMLEAARIIKDDEGLDILPASAGTLSGIMRLESRSQTYVMVATARGDLGPGRR